jgi:hypothetical protein
MQRKWTFLFTALVLFSLMLSPIGTAGAQRSIVADELNKAQVFDSSGAYPTTLAGNWDSTSGSMRGPSGIALDNSGNVYVADRDNHRIQKFAPGVPDWLQSNINGFGVLANSWIASLSTFSGQMYAGTWTDGTIPAQVWRSSDGQIWNQFTPSWTAPNDAVFDIEPFGSYFYVGTDNENGGEIWRSNGTTWEQVVSGGFGSANNYGVIAFAVFSNTIYAATSANDGVLQVYRSASGDAGSWTAVVSDGFGGNGVPQDVTMDVYSGYLYLGLRRGGTGMAEFWRTNDGTTWTPVFTNGLAANNSYVSAMANFGGTLYIGLRNMTTGGEVWRTTDGTTFTRVFDGGLGDSNNGRPYGLEVFSGRLYLVFSNLVTGAEVWRTPDGTNWQQVGDAGWGDSNNDYADYFDKGATVINNSLFIGTRNLANGGEIWYNTFTSFTDVSRSYWASSWIERLYAAGITAGCGGGNYCPEDPVTRAQMAIFLERGMNGSAYTPPAGTGALFADVPLSYWAVNWIEKLFADGITTGCSITPLNYCPEDSVTRAQMAIFLLRAKHGAAYVPPAAAGIFADVPTNYWAVSWIEQLYAEGITTGCGTSPLTYCPEVSVTRAQMAVFLVRTFNLP